MSKWAIPPNLHQETESGPLCFFLEHSIGSLDGTVPRYTDSQACVRCISSLTEGRVTLDVHRIHKRHRRKFLEFWSLVEIRDPSDCWPWRGAPIDRGNLSSFYIKRYWGRAYSYNAQRVAFWFTWGDVGRLPIVTSCGNNRCCNPLHLKVRGVPHFHHNRKLQAIDLEFSRVKLLQETQLFLETTAERDPERFETLRKRSGDWIEYRMSQGGDVDIDDYEEEEDDIEDVLSEIG
jgi:hypothetical protein